VEAAARVDARSLIACSSQPRVVQTVEENMKKMMAVMFVVAACATAGDEERVRRELQAEYDELSAAFIRQDVDAVLSFRTDDFHTISPTGDPPMNAEQMKEYTRNWLLVQNKPPIVVRMTVESVEVRSKDEAAAHVLQYASRWQEREGKLAHVVHEVRQRETWVRTPAGWKIREVDQIDLANRKRWINGVLEPKR
jgi:ketosteroid isomerase-like protein